MTCRFKENFFIVFLLLLVFEYETFLVLSPFFDKVIKIACFLVLFVFFRAGSDNGKNIFIRNILLYYAAIFLVMAVSFLMNPDFAELGQAGKQFLTFLILLIMLFKLYPEAFSDRVIKAFVFLGSILAIHSIILWICTYAGMEMPYEIVDNARIGRFGDYNFNPWWGNMEYVIQGGYNGVSRAVGYFLTPSRYGTFLVFPAFVGYGYYKLTGKKGYLMEAVACSIALFLTISSAAILSSFIALLFYFCFRRLSRIKWMEKRPFINAGIISLSGLSAIIVIHKIFQYIYASTHSVAMKLIFRLGGYKTVFDLFQEHPETLSRAVDYPLGQGFAVTLRGIGSQYAPIRLLVTMGYPGLLVFLLLFVYLFKVHVFPALSDTNVRIERYVALAFIAQTIAQIQEGSWWISTYFLTIGMLVLLKKYTFKQKNLFPSVYWEPH